MLVRPRRPAASCPGLPCHAAGLPAAPTEHQPPHTSADLLRGRATLGTAGWGLGPNMAAAADSPCREWTRSARLGPWPIVPWSDNPFISCLKVSRTRTTAVKTKFLCPGITVSIAFRLHPATLGRRTPGVVAQVQRTLAFVVCWVGRRRGRGLRPTPPDRTGPATRDGHIFLTKVV